MKRFVFRLLYLLGLPALFRFFHKRSLTIVLYHGVAPSDTFGIYNYRKKFISPNAFFAQLEYFKKHYTVLPLETALSRLQDGTLPDNTLAITFDDGYRNFAEYAYPRLTHMQMPATVFLATDFVFRNVPLWVDRLEYAIGREDGSFAEKAARDATERNRLKTLSPEIREHDLRNIEQVSFTQFNDFSVDRAVYAPLAVSSLQPMQFDVISFGAHTKSHPILSTMNADAQLNEIRGSREDISHANLQTSLVFAYPNGQPGDWNEDTIDTLKKDGFTHALTTVEGWNTASTPRYALRRMVLDGTEEFSTFANVVTGVRLFAKSFL